MRGTSRPILLLRAAKAQRVSQQRRAVLTDEGTLVVAGPVVPLRPATAGVCVGVHHREAGLVAVQPVHSKLPVVRLWETQDPII